MFDRRLIGALACVPLACGLFDSIQATTVVGGLVVRGPDVRITGQFDRSGGLVATAWVGDRETTTSTEPPAPIGDAEVRVTFGGQVVALPVQAEAEGLYGTNDVDDPTLTYEAGAAYTFEADTIGATFGGAATAPTPLSAAAIVLAPKPTAADPTVPEALIHPADTALTLSWPEQFGRYGYVTVLRANASAPDQPAVVFDNRPTTAQQILTLVAGSPMTQVEVPAATFDADGIYAVVLVALEKGSNLLPNTFIGSAFLVGSGEVVFLSVKRGG